MSWKLPMVEVYHTWKGQSVTVKGTLLPAEPEVGIMGPSLDNVHIFGEDGKEIVLTDDELEWLLNDRSLWESVDVRYYGD